MDKGRASESPYLPKDSLAVDIFFERESHISWVKWILVGYHVTLDSSLYGQYKLDPVD